ncbi:MAG: hypothetical protein AB1427_00760 [Thermodesulfobacteriota bacterium]
MQELSLTRHFEQRWLERVGNWPTPEAINHYLAHSVQVQWCEDFVRPDGTPFRMLAIYWHPELDIVMKIDQVERVAVTVLSRENWRHSREQVSMTGGRVPGGSDEVGAFIRPGLAERIAHIKAAFGIKCRQAES